MSTVHGRFFGETYYALEGAVANAGSAVGWATGLYGVGINDLEAMVTSVDSSGGVFFVPALSGLFAPYWRNDARALWIGMTRASTREHMLRAVLEGIAFRTGEILRVMKADSGFSVDKVLVDGGLCKSGFFLQTLADLTRSEIVLPKYTETTVLGAALAGAMGAGRFVSLDDVAGLTREVKKTMTPVAGEDEVAASWA